MKKNILISRVFLGFILGAIICAFIAFKSSPDPLPQSSSRITTMGGATVYKLHVDHVQYIVVTGNSGVAIIKHTPY
jgi:hypothetical protein